MKASFSLVKNVITKQRPKLVYNPILKVNIKGWPIPAANVTIKHHGEILWKHIQKKYMRIIKKWSFPVINVTTKEQGVVYGDIENQYMKALNILAINVNTKQPRRVTF